MNEFFSLQDSETLVEYQGKPCVSIYLPTTRIATSVQAESLQLKFLVTDAAEQLEHFSLAEPDVTAMLAPARELVANAPFWRRQQEGLALFLCAEAFYRYQLPISFEVSLDVGKAFHLKPLIPLLASKHLLPIYQEANNYPHLVQSNNGANLAKKAEDNNEVEEIERFHSLTSEGQTSTDLLEIVPQADIGRVDTLFVDRQAIVRGVYDRQHLAATFGATVDKDGSPVSRDLTDLAALYTLVRQGKVYLMTADEMAQAFGPSTYRPDTNLHMPLHNTGPHIAAIYRNGV